MTARRYPLLVEAGVSTSLKLTCVSRASLERTQFAWEPGRGRSECSRHRGWRALGPDIPFHCSYDKLYRLDQIIPCRPAKSVDAQWLDSWRHWLCTVNGLKPEADLGIAADYLEEVKGQVVLATLLRRWWHANLALLSDDVQGRP